jgi:dTDP-4-amino-4,6-dideoxygalactose transaminase
MEYMKSKGIQTSIHYPPIHRFSAYQGYPRTLEGVLHWTEEVGDREVTLPLFPGLSEEDIATVVETITDFFQKSQ